MTASCARSPAGWSNPCWTRPRWAREPGCSIWPAARGTLRHAQPNEELRWSGAGRAVEGFVRVVAPGGRLTLTACLELPVSVKLAAGRKPE
jgi:hypothetical protein